MIVKGLELSLWVQPMGSCKVNAVFFFNKGKEIYNIFLSSNLSNGLSLQRALVWPAIPSNVRILAVGLTAAWPVEPPNHCIIKHKSTSWSPRDTLLTDSLCCLLFGWLRNLACKTQWILFTQKSLLIWVAVGRAQNKYCIITSCLVISKSFPLPLRTLLRKEYFTFILETQSIFIISLIQ